MGNSKKEIENKPKISVSSFPERFMIMNYLQVSIRLSSKQCSTFKKLIVTMKTTFVVVDYRASFCHIALNNLSARSDGLESNRPEKSSVAPRLFVFVRIYR